MKTRRLVSLALMLGVSIAIHCLEGLIPLPVPGFRLGLCNVISLFVLYSFGGVSFLFLVFARVFLVALISSGFGPSFFMSLFGTILSSMVSLLLYYPVKSSIYSLSLSSALFHTLGQLLAYAIFFSSPYIFVLASYLAPLSMLAGILSAILVALILHRFPDLFGKEEKTRRKT